MNKIANLDLNSPDWKERSLEILNNCSVKELYDFCYNLESYRGFPIVFF